METFSQVTSRSAFGSAALKGLTIPVYAQRQDHVRDPNPNYAFSPKTLIPMLMWWMERESPSALYLWGHTGTGKTSLVAEFSARVNAPLYEMTASSEMDVTDLVGNFVMLDGDTIWVDSPLVMAVQSGGICLINEIDRMRPSVLVALNQLRDRQVLSITQKGETVPIHPDFRLVATGNTCGFGDETGAYPGSTVMDAAFMDGFTTIHVEWLDRRIEEQLLGQSISRIPQMLLDQMSPLAVRCATESREAFEKGTVAAPLSTRTLLRWLNYTGALLRNSRKASTGLEDKHVKGAMTQALHWAYLDRLPVEQSTAMLEALSSCGLG